MSSCQAALRSKALIPAFVVTPRVSHLSALDRADLLERRYGFIVAFGSRAREPAFGFFEVLCHAAPGHVAFTDIVLCLGDPLLCGELK